MLSSSSASTTTTTTTTTTTSEIQPAATSDAAEAATRLARSLRALLETPGRPEDLERSVAPVVAALATALRDREARAIATTEGAAEALTSMLTTTTTTRGPEGPRGARLRYDVALCVFALSFHEPAREAFARRGAAGKLVDLARTATKEKIVRVATLALRNVVEGGAGSGDAAGRGGGFGGEGGRGEEAAAAAAASAAAASRSTSRPAGEDENILKLARSLQRREYADEELAKALKELEEGALRRGRDASDWRRYRSEVLSGCLERSSARGDETFWRENAEKFTRDDCLVLRTLVHILERAADPKTLAVACHDLGMFATRWPAGRFLAEELGGKEKVARLMTHEDADVRKRAVTCMQRLLGFGSSASAA